jgi:DNA-binding response OmpR family regulator
MKKFRKSHWPETRRLKSDGLLTVYVSGCPVRHRQLGGWFIVQNVGFNENQPREHLRKVLIVDVDLRNVQEIGAALRRGGYDPLEATSFEAAKRLWMADQPPILIADVRLGEFNGLQLLLRAKADRPDVRAVITCAFPDTVLEAETRRFGGTFMVKPLVTDELLAVLSSWTSPDQPSASTVEERRLVADRRQVISPGFAPDRRVAERRKAQHAQG